MVVRRVVPGRVLRQDGWCVIAAVARPPRSVASLAFAAGVFAVLGSVFAMVEVQAVWFPLDAAALLLAGWAGTLIAVDADGVAGRLVDERPFAPLLAIRRAGTYRLIGAVFAATAAVGLAGIAAGAAIVIA